jgi:hypothetical protein
MLVPREHGAYGQLLLPLAAALLSGRPTAGAWALATAAACGFLAQEGLAVLAGRRGGRAARQQRRAALRAVAGFGGVCVASAASAVVSAPTSVRLATASAAILAVLVMALVRTGRERTLGGEVLVSIALTAWCAPVGLAARLEPRHALGAWAVWAVTFTVATVAVRGLIARTRREPWRWLSLGAVLIGAAGWWVLHRLALAGAVSGGLPLALAPAGVLSFVLWLAPLRAHHLRRIGWAIVATGLVTAALLLRSA